MEVWNLLDTHEVPIHNFIHRNQIIITFLMTYPVEVGDSSVFDKVIVIIETCRVVSILQKKIQASIPISSEKNITTAHT